MSTSLWKLLFSTTLFLVVSCGVNEKVPGTSNTPPPHLSHRPHWGSASSIGSVTTSSATTSIGSSTTSIGSTASTTSIGSSTTGVSNTTGTTSIGSSTTGVSNTTGTTSIGSSTTGVSNTTGTIGCSPYTVTVGVAGTVFDQNTGTRLSGVRVFDSSGFNSTFTNSFGDYSFYYNFTIYNCSSFFSINMCADGSPNYNGGCENVGGYVSTSTTFTANFDLSQNVVAAPPDPTNVAATPGSNPDSLSLSWNSGGGTTQGFVVALRQGILPPPDCSSGTNVGGETSMVFPALVPSAVYAFRVCSYNSQNTESSGAFAAGFVSNIMNANSSHGQTISAVTVGNASTVFVVDNQNRLWYNKNEGSGWLPIGSFVDRVSAVADTSGNISVFMLMTDASLNSYSLSTGRITPVGGAGTIKSMKAGTDIAGMASAYVTSTSNDFYLYSPTTGWQKIGTNYYSNYVALNRGSVYVNVTNDSIYGYSPSQGWFAVTSPGFSSYISGIVESSGNVALFAQTPNQALYLWHPQSGWAPIGGAGSIKEIDAGRDATGNASVFVISTAGDLVEYNSSGWSGVIGAAGTIGGFSATYLDRVFVIGGDHSVAEYDRAKGWSAVR